MVTDILIALKIIAASLWLVVAYIGFNFFSKIRKQSSIISTLFLLVMFLSILLFCYVISVQNYQAQVAMIFIALGFAIALKLVSKKTRDELDTLFRIKEVAVEEKEHLSHLAAHAFEGIYLVDPKQMKYLEVNPAGARALLYHRKEMEGMSLEQVHPDDMPLMRRQFERALSSGKRVSYTVSAARKDGKEIITEVALTKVISHGEALILAVGRDLTKRQKAQRNIEKINRLYELLTQSNRAITRVKTKQALYEKICEVSAVDGGFLLAWIGEIVDSDVVPVCYSGKNEGYVEEVGINLTNRAQVNGPVLRSIRTRRLAYVNDVENEEGVRPWRSRALERGFNSIASIPLLVNGEVCAVLNIYGAQSHVFDERMEQLLTNLSEDLSYALQNLDAQEKRLVAQKRLHLLSSAVDQSADAVTIMNYEGVIEYVNPKFTLLTGYSGDEIIGKSPSILACDKGESEKFDKVLGDLNKGHKWSGEFHNRKKSGERYWSKDTISPIKDDQGAIIQYVSTSEDYTALRAAQDKIEQLAFYDSLTGLPNRRLLHDRMKQAIELSAKSYTYVAVLMIDVDKFKNINDSLGHKAGDELIRKLSVLLSKKVTHGDTVARMGGDEFVVVLSNIRDINEVTFFAKDLLERIREPFDIFGSLTSVTVSIGITLFPVDGGDTDELIRSADLAMYHAKSEGRNKFEYYTKEMNERALSQLDLDRRLKLAVQNNRFELHYQPQVDMQTGNIKGVEALIRWVEDGHYIPPDKFIPVAEESGLMEQIGEWVIKQCFEDAVRLKALVPKSVAVAINLSASQFRNSDQLIKSIGDKIKSSGIAPGLIELELTESMLIENVDSTVDVLNQLRALGVTLAIDDFGTGYSSLSYLKNFPIDTLKIDRSFVQDIGTDPSDAAIVVAVIALARELNMGVLAEGVETEGQLVFLEGHGCDSYQGFFFAKPLPFDELVTFLNTKP